MVREIGRAPQYSRDHSSVYPIEYESETPRYAGKSRRSRYVEDTALEAEDFVKQVQTFRGRKLRKVFFRPCCFSARATARVRWRIVFNECRVSSERKAQ